MMSNFVDFNRGLWKKIYPVVKLERPKAYITEYIYVTNINKIKNKRDNICKAAPCTVFTEQWKSVWVSSEEEIKAK